MWQALMTDVAAVSRDVIESCQNGSIDKHEYMSLPRPGVCTNWIIQEIFFYWMDFHSFFCCRNMVQQVNL